MPRINRPIAVTPENAHLQLTAEARIDIDADHAAHTGSDVPPPLPRFRMVAYTGAPMRVSGWRHPVVLDLAGLAIPSQSRPIRFGHDPLAGVGHSDTIRVENGQLAAAGVISRDTPAAREVVTSAKNGFPWQASVGASVEEYEFVKDGQHVLVNGQSYTGPLNVVRKATLGEISFVDLGADGRTSASVAAQDTNGNESSVAVPPVDSLPAPSVPTAPPTVRSNTPSLHAEEVRAQALAESQRITAVRRLCAGRHSEIETQAIRDGWTVERTELEILRADRPRLPGSGNRDSIHTGRLLEAACLMAAKFGALERHFDEMTLDTASRRFHGGIKLQELLLEAAWANGYTGRNFREPREVLRYAFGQGIEAGWSTVDIGGLLANVANKCLLEGFYSVEQVWRTICAVRNVSDFKTVTSYRLIGKDQYERVAPGGELKHGTLGNETYSNKADTYGLMLSIDRRDLFNDNLGAITAVPRKHGRSAGQTINDIFWKTFLDNSTFFTAPRANYLSGAATNLGIDGLTAGEVAFLDQVDSDNKPTGIMPAILLVPTALAAVGSQLFKSMELRDNTANAKFPVANPHQGKFRVEVSRYLANGQYPGNSAKAWYLLADPKDLPVIEVAFLNGQETPTIESTDADFKELGVQMRGYHDFGVALQDPRGGVKVKGEA